MQSTSSHVHADMVDTGDLQKVYDDMATAIAESNVYPFRATAIIARQPALRYSEVLVLGAIGQKYVCINDRGQNVLLSPSDVAEVR